MTIETTLIKKIYLGNEQAREFAVPFPVADLDYLKLELVDKVGNISAVTKNYQIIEDKAGNIKLLYPLEGNPLKSGEKLVLYRSTPLTQVVDLDNSGSFHPEVIEKQGLDRIVMMVQEQQEKIDRSITVPISSDINSDELRDNIFKAERVSTQKAAEALESAGEAKASADNAKASADQALISETKGKDSELAADGSKNLAQRWAEEEHNVPVTQDEHGHNLYSAHHWATESKDGELPVASPLARGLVPAEGKADHFYGVDTDGKNYAFRPVEDLAELLKPFMQNGIPVGFEAMCPSATPPEGWLDESLDMGELQRAAYPELWEFAQSSGNIKTEVEWLEAKAELGFVGAFSLGDGATTFRIPLIRKAFVRAADAESDLQVGDVHGDAIRNIEGSSNWSSTTGQVHFSSVQTGCFSKGAEFNVCLSGSASQKSYDLVFDTSRVVPTAEENRPYGYVRLPIIKAYDVANVPANLEVEELVNQLSNVSNRVEGTNSSLEDTNSRLENLYDKLNYVVLYPGGTEAGPAIIQKNQRVVINNPFGSAPCIVLAEIYYKNIWGTTGHFTESASGTYPCVFCTAVTIGEDIAVQSGYSGISAISSRGGGAFTNVPLTTLTSAPYRVKVWKINTGM